MRVRLAGIFNALLFTFILVSCASEESRYRDTGMLERPPILVVEKKSGEQPERDDSAVSSKEDAKTGLSSKVYMTTSTPPLLMIRQPFDVAWDTLGNALRQDYIKISDREHDKGLYYVTYDADMQAVEEGNMLDKAMSFFKDERHEGSYVLMVQEKGSETQISAAINNEPKQSASSDDKNNISTPTADGAEKLLLSLYKTMSDERPNREKKPHRHHRD
ncbi:MAG: outer membrane protein assembly factor BamC [Methylobacter sp.]|nr:outer membrane protein assembly factor BamC [Methylobacter sp.]